MAIAGRVTFVRSTCALIVTERFTEIKCVRNLITSGWLQLFIIVNEDDFFQSLVVYCNTYSPEIVVHITC